MIFTAVAAIKKESKKLAIIGGIVMFVMLLFGGCGESPVAKVHMKEHLLTWAPGAGEYYISWVDVLEVYDKEDFSAIADKISEDGKRANLHKIEHAGKVSPNGNYYVYSNDSYLRPSKKMYLDENIFCWVLSTLAIYFILFYSSETRKMEG